jgi:DNA-binding response OmpR family regulator
MPHESILIVDDDPRLARAMLTRLRAVGYTVAHADTGAAALAALRDFHPHLIILDIRLPDMLGFQVCESIRAISTHRETPIVFVSANASGEDRRKAALAGGTDFLAKPCPSQTLLETVQRLCATRATTENHSSQVHDEHTAAKPHKEIAPC